MSATPPEANTEYSREKARSRGSRRRRPAPLPVLTGSISLAIFACGLVGAVLLVISEFTHLYAIHIASQHAPVSTIRGGSHNSYAFIPIALLALALAFGAARERSHVSLLALAALGITSLLIALLGDLPDAQASGLLMRGGHLVMANANPTVGMYLESLGSIALILAGGLGLLLGPRPAPPPPRSRPAPRPPRPRPAPPPPRPQHPDLSAD
jgi:hypothetical protein